MYYIHSRCYVEEVCISVFVVEELLFVGDLTFWTVGLTGNMAMNYFMHDMTLTHSQYNMYTENVPAYIHHIYIHKHSKYLLLFGIQPNTTKKIKLMWADLKKMRITFANCFRLNFSLYLSPFAYVPMESETGAKENKMVFCSFLETKKAQNLKCECEYAHRKRTIQKIINFFPHVSFVNFQKLSSFSKNTKQFSDSIFTNLFLHHFQGA